MIRASPDALAFLTCLARRRSPLSRLPPVRHRCRLARRCAGAQDLALPGGRDARRHPNLYHAMSRGAFAGAVRRLDDRIPHYAVTR